MSTELFRKYIDIINENQQPQMLDEGMMDMAKSLASKFMKAIGKDAIADIATKVKQVTGGDFSPTKENAIKVAKAFGFDKMNPKEVSEDDDYGLAGNWQGKLIQMLHLGGILGGAYQIATSAAPTVFQSGSPTTLGGTILVIVGMILLMATDAFWNKSTGHVGAMGRNGRKGFDTGG
jgi:hypothetical protein